MEFKKYLKDLQFKYLNRVVDIYILYFLSASSIFYMIFIWYFFIWYIYYNIITIPCPQNRADIHKRILSSILVSAYKYHYSDKDLQRTHRIPVHNYHLWSLLCNCKYIHWHGQYRYHHFGMAVIGIHLRRSGSSSLQNYLFQIGNSKRFERSILT